MKLNTISTYNFLFQHYANEFKAALKSNALMSSKPFDYVIDPLAAAGSPLVPAENSEMKPVPEKEFIFFKPETSKNISTSLSINSEKTTK